MASLEFTERMAGFVVPFTGNQPPQLTKDYKEIIEAGSRQDFEFTLTVQIQNVDEFIADKNCEAFLSGNVLIDEKILAPVPAGKFNLFVRPGMGGDIDAAKEMRYHFTYQDPQSKRKFNFSGFKCIEKEDAIEAWEETTTLYCVIQEEGPTGPGPITAVGILQISVGDFMKQLTTFKASDSSEILQSEAFLKFVRFFSSQLWEAYAPFFMGTASERWNDHPYPVNTTLGVLQGTKELIPLDTEDGLTISLQRFKVKDSRHVVLLVHGLTLSTDMFIMPEIQNLVNYLHQNQFTDVWSLDWRGSGRFVYNLAPHKYTIDDVAKYDIPLAVKYLKKTLGEDVQISIISHCVGAMSVMSSVAAGYTTGVHRVVANSVSLNPKSGFIALLKLILGPFLFQNILGYPYLSPKMPYMPGFRFGKWIYWFSRLVRWECREPACHMLSFMWGFGYPVAYKHKNLHVKTHRRLYDLFGGTSFEYYRHIRKMILRKKSVSYSANPQEIDYFDQMKSRKNISLLLTSGSDNLIFPKSNIETYQRLKEDLPNMRYFEIPDYGHQDVFMGKRSFVDYFPVLVRFLKTGEVKCK